MSAWLVWLSIAHGKAVAGLLTNGGMVLSLWLRHLNSFAFDDFVVWPPPEPPESLADYTADTPTDRLSSGTPLTDVDVDDVALTSQSTARRDRGKLPFVQPDWHEYLAYDEHPPTCIYYSIEWRLTINNRIAAKDTEQDVVLVPHAFWETFLCPKLEKLLDKKLPSNKSLKADEAKVVMLVTNRSERDLVKRFNELDIEWPILERRLQTWSRLFRAGKTLRIQMSFNYVETTRSPNNIARQGTKRVFSSVSEQMLSERAMQLDAEEASGHPSIWRDVYNLMRCSGPPCHLGPYCWRDTIRKEHYKLKTHHLRNLIKYVEQGCELGSHDDMLHEIREARYVERQRKQGASQARYPPINITNVMPAQTPQASTPCSVLTTPESGGLVSCDHSTQLGIPGLRDIAVKRYCDWYNRLNLATCIPRPPFVFLARCHTIILVLLEPVISSSGRSPALDWRARAFAGYMSSSRRRCAKSLAFLNAVAPSTKPFRLPVKE